MPLAPANRARLHATLASGGIALVWWHFPGPVTTTVLVLLLMLALLAWCSPGHYAPVQRGLDTLVQWLLVAITWTALAFVYFGVFTPLRFWRTLTRNDPLHLRPDTGATAETYLQPTSPAAPRFDRQF